MITPFLESLIHKGDAYMSTFSHGVSGYGTIQVNDNEYIIITDIYIHGFDNALKAGAPNADLYTVHSLTLQSKTSRNLITTRSDMQRAMQHFEVYYIHSTDVSININNMRNPGFWTIGLSPPPIEANELPLPLGYRGISSIRTVNFDPVGVQDTYKPLGDRDPLKVTNYKKQFENTLKPGTAINNPLTISPAQTYSYPLINFMYVTIRKTIPPNIIGNK